MDCDARVKYGQFFDQTTKHEVSGNYVKGVRLLSIVKDKSDDNPAYIIGDL